MASAAMRQAAHATRPVSPVFDGLRAHRSVNAPRPRVTVAVAADRTVRLTVIRRWPSLLRQRLLGSGLAVLVAAALVLLRPVPPRLTPPQDTTPVEFLTTPAVPQPPPAAAISPPLTAAPAAAEPPSPAPAEATPEPAPPTKPRAADPPPEVIPAPVPPLVPVPAPAPNQASPVSRPRAGHSPLSPVRHRPEPKSHAASPPGAEAAARPAPESRDQPGSTAATPSEMAAFEASMRQAVQRALVYPAAARLARHGGEVRVGFDFADGRPSNPIVVGSSDFPVLDRAALATVTQAQYPLPPLPLAHRSVHLTIVVQYNPERPE